MKWLTLSASTRSLIFRAYCHKLARSKAPIVFGPFRSELGFEVLYWLPMLHWVMKQYGISPDRCLALSRGGMGLFYPAKQQVDLYDLRTVDQIRMENMLDLERRGIMKQTNVMPWDRMIVREAADRVFGKDERVHLLHPSWMYWLFAPCWEDRATLAHVARHCAFEALPVPDLPEGLTLPPKFIAVKFYERHTLQMNEPVQQIVRTIVQALASKMPVVLLNQALFTDDHTDLPIAGPNIFALPTVAPTHNLILQAAVLARSQAFVGTYGGVAQWALRYQRPTLSFYGQFHGTAFAHRTLSQMLAARMNVPFEMADLKASGIWQMAFAPPAVKASTVTEAVPA